jgi:magnesium-transporting ATPase (P-type)
MVSGDHRSTAEAIAIKAGILRKDEQRKPMAVLHGEEFRKMVGSEPRKIISKEDGTVSYELEKSD